MNFAIHRYTLHKKSFQSLEYLGIENAIDLDQQMTAEDFAWYSHQLPACFYRIGTRNEGMKISSDLQAPLLTSMKAYLKQEPD